MRLFWRDNIKILDIYHCRPYVIVTYKISGFMDESDRVMGVSGSRVDSTGSECIWPPVASQAAVEKVAQTSSQSGARATL